MHCGWTAGSILEFETSQDLDDWHVERLAVNPRSHREYHTFCLDLLALPVLNVKVESVFSRHKRLLGKDRTITRLRNTHSHTHTHTHTHTQASTQAHTPTRSTFFYSLTLSFFVHTLSHAQTNSNTHARTSTMTSLP
jgi:hypothetical protein